MCCNFKSFATLKKENLSLKLIASLPRAFVNTQNWRKMKALVLFTCCVGRKTNSVLPSVQPPSVLISFTGETDLMLEGNHIRSDWPLSRTGVDQRWRFFLRPDSSTAVTIPVKHLSGTASYGCGKLSAS